MTVAAISDDLRDNLKPGDRGVLVLRVLLAAVQAAALYLLSDAAVAPLSWPATQTPVFIPLLIVFSYVPVIAMLGAGHVRARPLALWAAAAAVILAALGCHDGLRGRVPDIPGVASPWPSLPLWLGLTVSVFVANVLVVDGIVERRLRVAYPRHFDTAWKFGVQCALAMVFIGVFWGVLQLGAGLFRLIEVHVFTRLIEKRWFAFPASTLALAVAIHVTDVRPALIRGVRSMVLTLFSWLLPLLVVILLGFLASLPFLSLVPLWKTHFATVLLLISAGLLVFFINSCYQDGAGEMVKSRVQRIAARIGALELPPIIGLAAWALALRVGQYGLTVERVLAAALIIVLACYAAGYAMAAVRSPSWLQRIEITNLLAAYVFLGLVLALFSPLADPARLMVADQLGRLKSGAVSPDKFDFRALKFDGARWGARALEQLAASNEGPEAARIAELARQAQRSTGRYAARIVGPDPESAADMIDRVTVFPLGRQLPKTFLDDTFMRGDAAKRPRCPAGTPRCTARFIKLPDHAEEVLILLDSRSMGSLFEQVGDGHWKRTARLQGDLGCLRAEVETGEIRMQAHRWPDLVIGGHPVEVDAILGGCTDPR